MMKNIVQGLPYRSWVFIAALIFMLGIGAIAALRVVGVRKSMPAKHPDEAMILSARSNQDDTLQSDCLKCRLDPTCAQNDVLSENGPDEIYTLSCCSSAYPFVGEDYLVVRVRGERAILTWYEDKARAIYREMTTNELEELRSFIRKHSIDDLGSVSDIEGCSSHKCMTTYEYSHVKREGVIGATYRLPNLTHQEI